LVPDYLKRNVATVTGIDISAEMIRIAREKFSVEKYATEEQKDQVIFDEENLKDLKIITGNYVTIENKIIRHKVNKLAVDIYNYLLEMGE